MASLPRSSVVTSSSTLRVEQRTNKLLAITRIHIGLASLDAVRRRARYDAERRNEKKNHQRLDRSTATTVECTHTHCLIREVSHAKILGRTDDCTLTRNGVDPSYLDEKNRNKSDAFR